jgi:DNA repair photolyase
MIKEIQAKSILNRLNQPDPFFGLTYTMNLYRGCQHQCIYCDSRSLCYHIENFKDVLVKVNGPELLRNELARKRVKGTIGTGSMHDPYMPIEKERYLTGEALEIMAEFTFPVHIMTKSDLVLRDLDVIAQISRIYAAVTFTITTIDDDLGKKVEPGSPRVSARFEAMEALSAAGILTGVSMMPILPFIGDNDENISGIVQRAADCGAQYILPWMGMSLRDRQRAYYYKELDKLFPGLKQKYIQQYGNQYRVLAPNAEVLSEKIRGWCAQKYLATQMPTYEQKLDQQLPLL